MPDFAHLPDDDLHAHTLKWRQRAQRGERDARGTTHQLRGRRTAPEWGQSRAAQAAGHLTLGRSVAAVVDGLVKGRVLRALACALLASPVPSAMAQPTVYRCETSGKVAYSDAPCIGAKVIDATPTQGMDKMTGRSSKGKEVRRDEFRRSMDDAIRPLTGKSTEEMNVVRRRVNLHGKDQARCGALDGRLARLEAAAPTVPARDKAKADFDLYQARKQFFDLKC